MTKSVPLEFYLLLQEEGISLVGEGVSDIALKPEVALRAIQILEKAHVSIIGGEVWQKNSNRFIPTYDIWNIEREDFAEYDNYHIASIAFARKQVGKYLKSKDNIYVVLDV